MIHQKEILPEIGDLMDLEKLYLSNNQLTGQNHPEMANLTNFTRFFINDNQLAGEIPEVICDLSNHYFQSNIDGLTISELWFWCTGNQLYPPYPFCNVVFVGEQDTRDCD